MAIEKSEAIILRTLNFRDTSKILTAYTLDHGLVSLIAKGVRGARPRFGSALEIFAHVDLVYYNKDSRDLQLLSQASLLEAHLGLASNLERYRHACAVLEFLLKLLSGQEPPGKLYPLALRTLEVLEKAPVPSLGSLFLAFQIKAVSFLGHRPELFSCISCRESLTEPVYFAPLHGGTVCDNCVIEVDGTRTITQSQLGFLQRLMKSTLAELFEDVPSSEFMADTRGLFELFLASQLDRYEPSRSLRQIPNRHALGLREALKAGDPFGN